MQDKYVKVLKALLLTLTVAAVSSAPAEGKYTGKIIDGTLVPSTQFPAVALISLPDSICTGTLIADRFVLTAAHCVYDDRSRLISATGVQAIVNNVSYQVKNINANPSYVPRDSACIPGETDAAVLELENAVAGVTPIALYRTTPAVGDHLLLVGFGTQGQGQTGEDDTLPPDGFVNYAYTNVGSIDNTEFLSWTFFQGPGLGNTASGDSGGPAFITVGGVQYVHSITCGGTGRSEYGSDSTNTRVDTMASWIDSITGSGGSADPSPPPALDPNGSLVVATTKIDFRNNDNNIIDVTGTLNLPTANFAPKGKSVRVEVAGISQTFKLNNSGYGQKRFNFVRLKGSVSRGAYTSQAVKLTVGLYDGRALYNALKALFPTDTSSLPSGFTVTVPFKIEIGGVLYSQDIAVRFKARNRWVK